jgi:hypothetical protein
MSITQALTAIALTRVSSAVLPLVSHAQAKMTAEEAHPIGVDAYVYFYPLLTMDITRKQFTNIEPGKEFGKGPMNMFVSVPEYPPANFKGVVRSNFDTLYSIAWLDLTKEPLVIAAPDTAGRFYLLPMLDMWSDVFASPGWRTTGTNAAQFLVTPPGWTGTVPAGLNHLPAPTPFVWVIGRTKTDGAADYAAVHKIQAGYTVTPLSRLGKGAEPVSVKIDPAVDMTTPPKIQVDTLSAADYFAYAAELLKVHPAHSTDQPLLAQLKRIGIEPGKSFDMNALDPEIKAALETAPKDAQALMAWKVPTLARVVNGWSMNTDTMGVYGNYYLKRAIVAQMGLGANLPEDAIYPLNMGDENGKTLTLYDPEGFQVGNGLNRFAVSSWMPFKSNADGSLDIYFQNESPGKELEANWLPAPKGPFNLTMRLYGPKAEALNGKWNPPAVKQM